MSNAIWVVFKQPPKRQEVDQFLRETVQEYFHGLVGCKNAGKRGKQHWELRLPTTIMSFPIYLWTDGPNKIQTKHPPGGFFPEWVICSLTYELAYQYKGYIRDEGIWPEKLRGAHHKYPTYTSYVDMMFEHARNELGQLEPAMRDCYNLHLRGVPPELL